MALKNLKAFQGDFNNKLKQLAALSKWLKGKNIAQSPQEIVDSIFNPIRSFYESDLVMEQFDRYPENLGLPLWLGYVNRTIDHHNSNGLDFKQDGVEFIYYREFLMACHHGIDYSELIYSWQLFLLTDFLPDLAKSDVALQPIITLHKNAVAGKITNKKEWLTARENLEKVLNEVREYHSATYALRRTAYLSVGEVTEIEHIWTSSIESIVDAKVRKLKEHDPDINEMELRHEVWIEIMQQLLTMIRGWQRKIVFD